MLANEEEGAGDIEVKTRGRENKCVERMEKIGNCGQSKKAKAKLQIAANNF